MIDFSRMKETLPDGEWILNVHYRNYIKKYGQKGCFFGILDFKVMVFRQMINLGVILKTI